MTRAQRLGLGMVALFYGLMGASILLAIAILARNYRELPFVFHHFAYTMQVIITSSSVEALVAGITWFVFASGPIVLIEPQTIRSHRWQSLLVALPLALCAPVTFALLLLYAHHKTPTVPTIHTTIALVTFFYMGVASLIAIYQYMQLTLQAERNIESQQEEPPSDQPPEN
jgi:hypothetical protein